MKNRNKKILLTTLILIIIGLVATRQLAPKLRRYLERQEIEKENIETMESIKTFEEETTEIPILRSHGEPTPLPEKAYLEVQFICQAPLETEANWVHHEESCEEAAALMAFNYATGQTITKPEAHEEILSMITWQETYFGSHKDLYSEETKEFIVNYYDLEQSDIMIIENATIEDMKRQIATGHPVIVPVTSGLLSNPYYPHPGYHMLLVIGYTEDKIITNDNGTRNGEDFTYNTSEFATAMKSAEGNVLVITEL